MIAFYLFLLIQSYITASGYLIYSPDVSNGKICTAISTCKCNPATNPPACDDQCEENNEYCGLSEIPITGPDAMKALERNVDLLFESAIGAQGRVMIQLCVDLRIVDRDGVNTHDKRCRKGGVVKGLIQDGQFHTDLNIGELTVVGNTLGELAKSTTRDATIRSVTTDPPVPIPPTAESSSKQSMTTPVSTSISTTVIGLIAVLVALVILAIVVSVRHRRKRTSADGSVTDICQLNSL